MNTRNDGSHTDYRALAKVGTLAVLALVAAAFLLAGCASTPVAPAGAADLRARLTRLQGDPELSGRAPAALREAEVAVRAAEQPIEHDDLAATQLGAHRVYVADRMVDTAAALARTSLAVDQRAELTRARDQARLDARTDEADRAANKLVVARAALADERMTLEATRTAAATAAATAATDAAATAAATAAAAAAAASADARAATAASDAAAEKARMQQQLDALQAKQTDRGLVLTLGDVLFASGRSELGAGAAGHLDRLANFLNSYPDRDASIEGHTDSVGSEEYNQGLSQRRADTIKAYLVHQGIAGSRLSATGQGESDPVADNSTAVGRGQNRRVEVIIANPRTASR